MSLKTTLQKSNVVMRLYIGITRAAFRAATLISPTLNTKMRYKSIFGKTIDLENPQIFYEKLSWLKLNRYNHDPLVAKCADKYAVREYVKECGYEHILNEIFGAYDSVLDIPWNDLPNQFVLKWNFGSGMNILCRDKNELDIAASKKQLNKWKKDKCWLPYAELHYKKIPQKIVCEKFLEDSAEETIPDYKVYCFHGEPVAILVIRDRGKAVKVEFFDCDWNFLESDLEYKSPNAQTKRPSCLSEMLMASQALSKPFPFVRCDFYVVDDKLYFGELTFTPAGGLHTFTAKPAGKDMTDFLHIP